MTFFGHQHLNLSRVFTVNGVSYQVCLSCGAELEYDLATMQLTGTVIERAITHPDTVAIARSMRSTFNSLDTGLKKVGQSGNVVFTGMGRDVERPVTSHRKEPHVMPKPIVLPLSIDDHAKQYLELKDSIEIAQRALAEKKKNILKLVNKTGDIPAGANKSLRLEGDEYVITATYGHTSSIDSTVVGKIQAALAANRTPSLFAKIFKSVPTPIQKLFARVMQTKPRDPSLSVEPKKKAGR